MSPLAIREATPADWPAIWAIFRAVTAAGDAYAYDELFRLTSATVQRPANQGTVSQAFTYDQYGNQTSSFMGAIPTDLVKVINNFTFDPAHAALNYRNQLPAQTSTGDTGAAYDPQGNLISLYKHAGNSGEAVNLTYDALGRVIRMEDLDPQHSVIERYFYSAEGLRTRIETYQGLNLIKVQHKLYNDQRQLVSEYEAVPQ
jgi:YD repeat-containing protein